jgi:hypothetical protein
MNTIQFMNVRLERKPIVVQQLIRKFNYPGLYKRMYMARYDRKLYYKDMLITWELWNKETYYTANGVRYDNKMYMAAALGINYHSVKSRKGDEWYFKGIHFRKFDNLTICRDKADPLGKHISLKNEPKKEALTAVKATFDVYKFNGIKLVRKFLNGNLVNTYAYDRGAQYLKA